MSRFVRGLTLTMLLGTSFIPMFAHAASCSDINPCPSGQSCNSSGVCVDTSTGSTDNTLYNPLGTTDLWALVKKILSFIIKVGAVVVVFMVVYVGFMFVTAQGNESKLTAAKQALLWTIVGAVILLGAQVISSGICETVNALTTGSTITCSPS